MCTGLLCQLDVNFESDEAILTPMYHVFEIDHLDAHPSRCRYQQSLRVPLRKLSSPDFTSKIRMRRGGGGDELIDGFHGVLCVSVGWISDFISPSTSLHLHFSSVGKSISNPLSSCTAYGLHLVCDLSSFDISVWVF